MRDKIKLVSSAGTGHYYHRQEQEEHARQDGDQKVRSCRTKACDLQRRQDQVKDARTPGSRNDSTGIEPYLTGHTIQRVHVRNHRLRWPVSLPEHLSGSPVLSVSRRAKYILIETVAGALVVHLGMSAACGWCHQTMSRDCTIMSISKCKTVPGFDTTTLGVLAVFTLPQPNGNPLAVEQVGSGTAGTNFPVITSSQHRETGVSPSKNFIMDGKVVVGVANIYAAESLFRAGIRPGVAAHRVSRLAYQYLAEAIRQILANAINVGGTTLRDFVGSDGQPGYFNRASMFMAGKIRPVVCANPLLSFRPGQRSTVYCPTCQTFSGWKTPVC